MVARKAVTALLVVVVVLWGCDSRRDEGMYVSVTKEMQTLETARSHSITIPAIDAAAAARTETATFALG